MSYWLIPIVQTNLFVCVAIFYFTFTFADAGDVASESVKHNWSSI